MERLTMSAWPASLPPPLPAFMEDRGYYDNRLQAVRDRRRNGLEQAMLRDGVAGECVAVLFDVYNHTSGSCRSGWASRTTHTTTFKRLFCMRPEL
jgi:metal-responsive CopG/Arc/MetJ family transcriptional regulator